MYILKFLKWFCIEHMDDSERRYTLLFIWVGSFLFAGFTYAFTGHLLLLIIWAVLTVSGFAFNVLLLLYIVFSEAYDKWQLQVFNKLKDQ